MRSRLVLPALALALCAGAPALAQEESPQSAQEQMEDILENRQVTLNFPDTPLVDAVMFLQDISGLNFVLDPRVADETVSLRLRDITMGNALDMICTNAGIEKTFWCDVLYLHEEGRSLPVGPDLPAGELGKKLRDQSLTINFDETPFEEAVDFFRDITGLNFVITRAARDAARDGQVSLRVRDLTLQHVLTVISDQVELAWSVDNGVITFDEAPEGDEAAAAGGAAGGANAEIDAILDGRRVTLNFDETPLGDVLMFLQDITGLNIVADANVDVDDIDISLRLRDISLRNAMDLIAAGGDLSWRVQNEAVIFSRN